MERRVRGSIELTELGFGDTEGPVNALNPCLGAAAAVGALLGALCAVGCAPEPLTAETIDVIATRRSEDADFSDSRTFAMPADVIDLCAALTEIPPGGLGGAGGQGGAGSVDGVEGCIAPDHSLDDLVLDGVRAELEALGYEEVDSSDDPDIAVLIGFVAQDQLRLWEGVPWCYAHELFPGCWEPSYDYPYNLQFGALLMDFVLPEESQADEVLEAVWTAVLSGVGRPDADEDRMTLAIETAFEQSPYLADGGAQ